MAAFERFVSGAAGKGPTNIAAAGTPGVKVNLNLDVLKKLEKAGPAAMSRFANEIVSGAKQRVPVASGHKDPWPGVKGPLKDSIQARMRKNPDDGALVMMHYYGYFVEFGHQTRGGTRTEATHFVDRAAAAAEAQIDKILDDVT